MYTGNLGEASGLYLTRLDNPFTDGPARLSGSLFRQFLERYRNNLNLYVYPVEQRP